MSVPIWPAGLPTLPMQGPQVAEMYEPPAETEMEDGTIRARRRTAANWTKLTLSYMMTADQFQVFQVFVRDTLQHGSQRFMMPMWRPGATLPLPSKLTRIAGGQPTWRPAGKRVVVTLPVAVQDY